MDDIEKDLRERLAKVGQQMWDANLVSGSAGNTSVRIPGTKTCLIKPSGFRMCDVKPDEYLIVDIYTREVLKGTYKPSNETPFHTMIYRIREDVRGVVHTHSYYVTILATLGVNLVPMFQYLYSALHLVNKIGIVEYATGGSEQLSKNVESVLKNNNAALMPHHGAIVIGKTIEEAYSGCLAIEALAKFQFDMMKVGKPVPLPDSTLQMLIERYEQRNG